METDCAFVRSFLANENLDRSSLVDLKKEALSISKMLKNFKIAKINRQANKVAHEIAKFSFINKSDGILLNSVPPCVAIFVQSHLAKEGNYISGRESWHPRIGESYPDTGEGLLPCIFMAHQSGPYHIARTPEDPLIQDSLSDRERY